MHNSKAGLNRNGKRNTSVTKTTRKRLWIENGAKMMSGVRLSRDFERGVTANQASHSVPSDTRINYDKRLRNWGGDMRLIFIPVLGIFATLAGCVSFSTPMKNARGEVVNCQNSGFGWLGAPMATINQKRCESNMRERGFVPPGESPPPAVAAPTPGFSEPNSAGGPTATASNRTVKVSISLPSGWNEIVLSESQIRNGVSVSATNPASEAFIALSARSKANLADLRAFALAMQADQSARVSSAEISVISKIEIDGKQAYAMHVIGTPQGAPQPIRFNMFVIEGASEIALLNIWVPEKIYQSKKQQIDDLLMGLKGLDS